MGLYEKQFTKPYPNGYVDKPQKTTPVTADILNMQDDTFAALEDFLTSDEIVLKDRLAVGTNNNVSGTNSTAFGIYCTSSGRWSHAEGGQTTASAPYAHAEGTGGQASGTASHVEGSNTKAQKSNSHAEGNGTVASGDNQHVQGKFNVEDTQNKYAHIVGGGSSNNDRKNIYTLDWQGNAIFSGNVTNGNGVSLDDLAESIDNAPVSAAQQSAIDAAYQQVTGYTDQQIAELINGAPETLNTLGEIAEAMKNNSDVVDALNAAIGTKASQAEVDGHIGNDTIHIKASERQSWNDKQTKTGDIQDNIVTFESGDAIDPTGWANVALVTTKEKVSSLMRKLSLTVKNMRYLFKLIGNTQLSIGDGTITGAINELNTDLKPKSFHPVFVPNAYVQEHSLSLQLRAGLHIANIGIVLVADIQPWSKVLIANISDWDGGYMLFPIVSTQGNGEAFSQTLLIQIEQDGTIYMSSHGKITNRGWFFGTAVS